MTSSKGIGGIFMAVLQVKIEDQTKSRLRVAAAIKECSMGELADQLIREGLDRIEAGSPTKTRK